ncbi:hypothetical protein OOJ91_30695 [Micromonospora lupini]|uniref:hypothetical protein n=1 Tax=Micromonospora lupini TaxID=285679 RepID=UPI00225AC3B0|nr:hypothetical protein [Micromonospora lupini]MCX5070224.1 hypothetical protein [Micromonospora lupini]
MTTDGTVAFPYSRLVAVPPPGHADQGERWTRAAQVVGEAADELRRLHRLLPGHWQAGSGQQETDEVLRRLVRQLDEAYDAYTRIAAAVAGRERDLAQARRLALEAVAEARLAGLVVTPAGEVVPPSGAVTPPMAVRATAGRLTARIVDATARAEAAEQRAAEDLAGLPLPHPR